LFVVLEKTVVVYIIKGFDAMVRLVWMGFNQISEVEKSFVVAAEINK